MYCLFCFKQKTAYVMRISDWSSDVCSSDLVSTDGIRTLPRLLGSQARASAPDAHVWLSASAGTGKTPGLAARAHRPLLRGVDRGAILCLTFTKAGGAQMAGRISKIGRAHV